MPLEPLQDTSLWCRLQWCGVWRDDLWLQDQCKHVGQWLEGRLPLRSQVCSIILVQSDSQVIASLANYPLSQVCRMCCRQHVLPLKKGTLSWNAKLDASCTKLQKHDAWARRWTSTRGVQIQRFGTPMDKRRQDNAFHIAFLLRAPLVATCT